MEEIDVKQKQIMYEKHLISAEMLKKPYASVMITNDENMSIMLMEEDHIRLQVIMGGRKLKEAYDLYKKEIKFEKNLDKLKNNDYEADDEKLKLLITSFSYIFNL